MKRKLLLFLIVLLNLFLTAAVAKEIICQLEGKVVNRSSKAVLLMKAGSDPRSSLHVRIPIVEGAFSHKLIASSEEAYQLIFEDELTEGAFREVIFFPDSAEVKLKLYSLQESESKNEILGGRLNRIYKDHMADFANAYKSSYMTIRQKRQVAIAAKTYYTAAYDSLVQVAVNEPDDQRRLFQSKLADLKRDGGDLSPVGREISLEERDVVNKMFIKRYDFIRLNPSPVSYFMLYNDLMKYSARELPIFLTLAPDVYDVLSKVLPGHPYTQKAGYLIHALKIQAGQPLVDFQAPDIEGKKYQLSTLANSKVTLLDLWASWCAPCINKSRQIMPIYDRYKAKGFQVIGVAREFGDKKNLVAALAREKHTWLTLVDLEDENLIWHKYGLSNSGGGIVLFDRKGKIVAMNPSIAEIERLLEIELK